MKKEWFASKELVGIAGLPVSPQGINLRARREGWPFRQRKGVQGRALEYHISSLPASVVEALAMLETPERYTVSRQEPMGVWIEAYHQLTEREREQVVRFIMQEGVGGLLAQLGYDGKTDR